MPLRGLTEEQRVVAEHEGNLLLTACPGSGKTRTLVSKIAYQLSIEEKSNKKRRIIAITFTNIAADTILDRLDSYGIENSNLWVGTIHSFCLEWIIKPYQGYSERISKGYRIIDEYEQGKIILGLKKEFEINIYDDLPTKLNDDFSINGSSHTKHYHAATTYHQHLNDNKLIDFDLILTISIALITNHPEIPQRLGALFSSILVDEYQDTNQQQYDILGSIIRHSQTHVTLVGDVDQAIYTGLGAVVKNAEQIKNEFSLSSINEKTLSGCFRSTQRIIDFYRNFQDTPIDINSLSNLDPSSTAVEYTSDINRDDLGEYVATLIDKHIDEGVSADEIAVLTPQWFDAINLGAALRAARPNLEFNAPGISPIPKGQDNPWINLIRLFFTPICAANYSRRKRLSSRVLEDLRSMSFSLSEPNTPIKHILTAINSITPQEDSTVEVFIDSLISQFSDFTGLDLAGNLRASEALLALIGSTTERISRFNIENNASALPNYFKGSDGIDVAVFHSTKGDEYDVVIATGLVKGKLPHWNDVFAGDEQADYMARRILYVVSSRARKYLHLISEQGHKTRRGTPLTPTPQLINILS